MKIYISIENKKVKSYQIGISSENEKIAVPSEYSLNDLEFLTIETIENHYEIPLLDENNEPIVDQFGEQQVVFNSTIEYVFSLDNEEKQQKEEEKNLERALSDLRNKRDQLLRETDFTQLEDAPLNNEEKEAYRTYRQELRDLPETTENILNPVFPVKP